MELSTAFSILLRSFILGIKVDIIETPLVIFPLFMPSIYRKLSGHAAKKKREFHIQKALYFFKKLSNLKPPNVSTPRAGLRHYRLRHLV
jgi:hypothetical protein